MLRRYLSVPIWEFLLLQLYLYQSSTNFYGHRKYLYRFAFRIDRRDIGIIKYFQRRQILHGCGVVLDKFLEADIFFYPGNKFSGSFSAIGLTMCPIVFIRVVIQQNKERRYFKDYGWLAMSVHYVGDRRPKIICSHLRRS